MKHNRKKTLLFSIALLLFAGTLCSAAADDTTTPEPSYLYKATFVRAAPGKLLDLIDLYKKYQKTLDNIGDERPFWWRHTQGDQWDLMLLFPMKSYADFYSQDKVAQRKKLGAAAELSYSEFKKQFQACSAWHEDIFVMGPRLKQVQKAFHNTSYYHVEIFIALPGKHAELYKEREMENAYQAGIGRPVPMIFTRDQGAAWDMFTLGCYRDLKHWASSEDIPSAKKQAAAKAAGFENAAKIGPYLRTLIYMHRDTMGVAIR